MSEEIVEKKIIRAPIVRSPQRFGKTEASRIAMEEAKERGEEVLDLSLECPRCRQSIKECACKKLGSNRVGLVSALGLLSGLGTPARREVSIIGRAVPMPVIPPEARKLSKKKLCRGKERG